MKPIHSPNLKLEHLISRLLQGGVLCCGILFVCGLFLHKEILFTAGLLLLIALPILRVVLAFLYFLKTRDFLFVFFSGLVLTLLSLSYFLGHYL